MIRNLRTRMRLGNFFFVGTLTMVGMHLVTRDWRFQLIAFSMLCCQGVMCWIAKHEVERLRKLSNERTDERRTPPD